jgi:hypothetical protein
MGSSRQRDVYEVLDRMFTEASEKGNTPQLGDPSVVIARELNISPAEVTIHLRQLHRQGRIGLANGTGHGIAAVARTQEMITVHRATQTLTGAKLAKPKSYRGARTAQDAEEVDNTALLRELRELREASRSKGLTIERQEKKTAELIQQLRETRAALQAAQDATASVRAELTSAKRTIRALQAEVDASTETERKLAAAHHSDELSAEMAAAIAQLTAST